jgi:hypothetical protein
MWREIAPALAERFVDTVELLFMSYYGEPLDTDM